MHHPADNSANYLCDISFFMLIIPSLSATSGHKKRCATSSTGMAIKKAVPKSGRLKDQFPERLILPVLLQGLQPVFQEQPVQEEPQCGLLLILLPTGGI